MAEENERLRPADEIGPPFDQFEHDRWFLIAPHALPEDWRDRAVPVYMVKLNSEDVKAFVPREISLQERLDPEEKSIARLLAQGVQPSEIANTLHLSRRSVFRRLARLRQLTGAKTNAELATKLAKQDI
ncbi:MAG: hypothetical protein M3285_07255 [Actinomycetota bacterium]|nr:hypothetical protein [Actinomycetota bacterium]